MHRRKLLALGAAAVSFPGCTEKSDDAGTMFTPTRTAVAGKDAGTVAGTGTDREQTTPKQTRQPIPTETIIGGSLHGRPYRLGNDLALIEESNATWIHAFFDIREKYNRDVNPHDDPDVATLRRASAEMGARLFVSLQWNFIGIFREKKPVNIPPPGSSHESALIDYAIELLTAIDQPVEIIGLGNEPIWETKDEDFQGSNTRLIPFTRTLKEQIVQRYNVTDPQLIIGAFNRLYSKAVRQKYENIYRRLFTWARNDDDIDGIDLHVHYTTLEQAERCLAIARRAFPEGMITATEFSPVWRYKKHKDEPIAEFEGGDQFADQYGIPEDMTVAEYLEAAKEDRLSHREIADFYDAMPWYNVNFVDDMYRLLNKYDITVGTFGFLTERDIRQLDWTRGWNPFQINCLFQPGLIASETGAHPHYLSDFRERA